MCAAVYSGGTSNSESLREERLVEHRSLLMGIGCASCFHRRKEELTLSHLFTSANRDAWQWKDNQLLSSLLWRSDMRREVRTHWKSEC